MSFGRSARGPGPTTGACSSCRSRTGWFFPDVRRGGRARTWCRKVSLLQKVSYSSTLGNKFALLQQDGAKDEEPPSASYLSAARRLA